MSLSLAGDWSIPIYWRPSEPSGGRGVINLRLTLQMNNPPLFVDEPSGVDGNIHVWIIASIGTFYKPSPPWSWDQKTLWKPLNPQKKVPYHLHFPLNCTKKYHPKNFPPQKSPHHPPRSKKKDEFGVQVVKRGCSSDFRSKNSPLWPSFLPLFLLQLLRATCRQCSAEEYLKSSAKIRVRNKKCMENEAILNIW